MMAGMSRTLTSLAAAVLAVGSVCSAADKEVPRNVKELWADFDADAPLDVQVVRKWDDGGAHLELVRYSVGSFKAAR